MGAPDGISAVLANLYARPLGAAGGALGFELPDSFLCAAAAVCGTEWEN